MIHLDDGVLRAWIDRELGADTAAVAAHIEDCEDCRARVHELQRAEAVVRSALGLLDGPVPRELAWARVAAGSGARRVETPRPRPVRWRDAPLARAAGIALLAAGGVAAATLPGSPLRTPWNAPAEHPADAAGMEVAPASAAAMEAGIRAPAGAAVRVELSAPRGTPVEVVVSEGRAGVFGAPSAEFAAGDGWLRATVVDGAVRVEAPRAGTLEIESNGAVVAVVTDGAFTRIPAGASALDEDGRMSFEVR